jgi:hypothetical protein
MATAMGFSDKLGLPGTHFIDCLADGGDQGLDVAWSVTATEGEAKATARLLWRKAHFEEHVRGFDGAAAAGRTSGDAHSGHVKRD